MFGQISHCNLRRKISETEYEERGIQDWHMNDVVETIYLAAFICNTLLCRFREEEIVVVFVIFITMMKTVSIFIRVICNNRQPYFDIFSILQQLSFELFSCEMAGKQGRMVGDSFFL